MMEVSQMYLFFIHKADSEHGTTCVSSLEKQSAPLDKLTCPSFMVPHFGAGSLGGPSMTFLTSNLLPSLKRLRVECVVNQRS